jgi:ABC-type methionine transport system ATPase subunit
MTAARKSAIVRQKVYLTYPKTLIKEPVLHRLGKKFRVVTNLRGANISDEIGLVALEIDGAENEVERAVAWLRQLGIQVEPLEKNVIE